MSFSFLAGIAHRPACVAGAGPLATFRFESPPQKRSASPDEKQAIITMTKPMNRSPKL